jgi:hypothetical protein
VTKDDDVMLGLGLSVGESGDGDGVKCDRLIVQTGTIEYLKYSITITPKLSLFPFHKTASHYCISCNSAIRG